MSHQVCLSCGSENISEVEYVQAYFREGDFIRLRTIYLQHIEIANVYHATCPEICGMELTGMSPNPLFAIKALGDLLKETYHVELQGKHF